MNEKQKLKIEQHGKVLQDCFKCYDLNPLKLCKILRKYELEATEITTRQCNGEETPEDEARLKTILESVNLILNPNGFNIPIFINTDPRGYALKIDDNFMRKARVNPESVFNKLQLDWGGYGLIAPEITGEE